jgi:hypothetical protein
MHVVDRGQKMRRLTSVLALLAALTVTAAAVADVPAPVVSACRAEYAQLGADAFAAKYGPTEPWGHCYELHMTTAATPTATTSDSPAVTACKAEYVQLGPTAFMAKYGTSETLGNCVKAHTTTTSPPTTSDSPAVAACKAEYMRLGPTAFMAKYGTSETLGNCVKAHSSTTTPTTTTSDNPAVSACKAEYVKLGADAFGAKYGKDALGQCVKLHGGQPQANDPAASVATVYCQALAKSLGKDAFLAKFGPKEAMGNCIKASLATAKSLVASCKASSGSSKDAFKACLIAGLQPQRR